ncbi:MAG TPA: hypothetical protein VEB20_18585 [Azospirillaceae bacterium]|nr:hypothetical protein [Azospirillaceae bacterium]
MLILPAALAACASPCERIEDDFRQLNADAIRRPGLLMDGTYLDEFRDLAARSVENRCLE